ncbi:PREDICTED: B-box zinc finger protein 21-like [Ipomoea nil]|uniref:B-box zinc finger protein 21-like n=1 Tax=Ipomoea nil TaxID=35883 RepID=UPI00090176CA|nr:PREDICTED: B-box zinc finger protein 21-like [Ipomoea nil]
MKIQCDVCEKEEASFFCSADEAALCRSCDHQVHHANKLATKHLRFSLIHPASSAESSQHCDICQERRALLFCKEDRAILCRDCDLRMHKANEHTQKHSRFLLTGVKLSSFDVPNQLASSSESSAVSYTTPATMAGSPTSSQAIYETSSNPQVVDGQQTSQEGAVSATSSISEYLLETLPGWHVQDFLDYPSSSTTYHF